MPGSALNTRTYTLRYCWGRRRDSFGYPHVRTFGYRRYFDLTLAPKQTRVLQSPFRNHLAATATVHRDIPIAPQAFRVYYTICKSQVTYI